MRVRRPEASPRSQGLWLWAAAQSRCPGRCPSSHCPFHVKSRGTFTSIDPGIHGRGQAALSATTLPSSHSLRLKQRPSTPGLPRTLGWGWGWGGCQGRRAAMGPVVEKLTAAPHPGGSHPVCTGLSICLWGICLALSFSWALRPLTKPGPSLLII